VELFTNEELHKLVNHTILHLYTPFDKMKGEEKKLLRSFKYLFKGFYYSLFYTNFNNINDYIKDGLFRDNELMDYWNEWNILLESIDGEFDL